MLYDNVSLFGIAVIAAAATAVLLLVSVLLLRSVHPMGGRARSFSLARSILFNLVFFLSSILSILSHCCLNVILACIICPLGNFMAHTVKYMTTIAITAAVAVTIAIAIVFQMSI